LFSVNILSDSFYTLSPPTSEAERSEARRTHTRKKGCTYKIYPVIYIYSLYILINKGEDMKLKINIVNNNEQTVAKAIEPNCTSLIINGIVVIANGQILEDTPLLEDHEAEHGAIVMQEQGLLS